LNAKNDNSANVKPYEDQKPKTKDGTINWDKIRRVLVVRLRSIGDTVLATPSLISLRRFLPEARIDILLEDWVAPVLEGFEAVDNIITVSHKDTKARFRSALKLRGNKYDVAFNLHGGTTATFFVRASGARHRVGYRNYSYNFLYTHLAESSSAFWQQEKTHSAEQQLALLGSVGVPVSDRPKSRLNVQKTTLDLIAERLNKSEIRNPKSKIALLHPVAAFATKQWATENFAKTAEFLGEKGFHVVAVATAKEKDVLVKLKNLSKTPVLTFDDLTLAQITALSSKAEIFVGNDSGIAHIAAAVQTPSVVIFGSSNVHHWHPWTDAKYEIVRQEMPCAPCAGYFCREFETPRCIEQVAVDQVYRAIDKVLAEKSREE
jgi:lipopolysaccharide heptosyltransferase II